jgi:hypothetical protein
MMLVNSCAHFMFVMSWPFTVLTESPLIQLATLYILSEACTFIAEGSIYMIYFVSFVITLSGWLQLMLGQEYAAAQIRQ